MANLFLIPTPLDSECSRHSLLDFELHKIKHVTHFIVETAKIGRAHIKQLNLDTPLRQLEINELNKHNQNITDLAKPLLAGFDLGLISDCGVPAIADPGRDIVTYAHQHNIKVIPLIGPSSLILALMASGANGQNFAFCGYLAIDQQKRQDQINKLQDLIAQGQSQIIIETPFRNNQLFNQLVKQLSPTRRLCIAVNLTTPTQFIMTKSILQWRNDKNPMDLHKQQVVFVLS